MKKDRRRRAREAALQILYQWDVGRGDIDRAVETYFDLQWPDDNPAPDEIRAFASTLARETVERLPVIDPLIADTADAMYSKCGVAPRMRQPRQTIA